MSKTVIKKAQIEEFLRKISVFELLETDHLQTLTKLVVVRQLKGGEIVWLQGQRVTHFTVVFFGRLRTVRGSVGGSEKHVSTLSAGYHFGLAEMITGAISSVTLVADGPATILCIDYKSLRRELLSNVEICFHLMQTMARAIFDLTRELERTSFENVHTRLARLLLKGKPRQSPLSQMAVSDKKITHEQLAVRLGVSRETVSRVLADFRRKKLITTSYRHIDVLSRDGLMEYIEDYDQW